MFFAFSTQAIIKKRSFTSILIGELSTTQNINKSKNRKQLKTDLQSNFKFKNNVYDIETVSKTRVHLNVSIQLFCERARNTYVKYQVSNHRNNLINHKTTCLSRKQQFSFFQTIIITENYPNTVLNCKKIYHTQKI